MSAVIPYFVFLYMYIGCCVVAAYADELSARMISDIKRENIEVSRLSLGLNMGVYAPLWPILLWRRPK